MKIIVTTYPFNAKSNLELSLNTLKRKYTENELINVLKKENPDIIIAGTENYNKEVLDNAPNLKLISRVGVGFDNIDFNETNKRNIIVTYTPDAPSNAVAELTICQMLNLLRKVPTVNKTWNRYIGRELSDCNVGIIGYGRIGSLVANKLNRFNTNIYINDIDKNVMNRAKVYSSAIPIEKNDLFEVCDIITIHIPLNSNNVNYITKKELSLMKKDVCLINTSRGGILNENDVFNWLNNNENVSAAIDVFETEPYDGILNQCKNAYLTPHIGSCTTTSRNDMERSAIIEVENFINDNVLNNVLKG